ncbi:MAG: CoB--CoM heterodisulfide reductase iron-sulfur subunit A family protein [Dehalococcoidia bacterium]|nr:CoB--CoM heterodisulfide reductase iron-sulfur subunit A family protein [Dehalococcoidia bacterium]
MSYQDRHIRELGLNRVVVASCSPRMHELTFRKACQYARLNPYLYEHVNAREYCSWCHKDKEQAAEKAKDLVLAAVKRVYYHEPIEAKETPVNPNTLVVGEGIAGIEAALKIANGGHQVYLGGRELSIGGHMIQLGTTFPTLDCSERILTSKDDQGGASSRYRASGL